MEAEPALLHFVESAGRFVQVFVGEDIVLVLLDLFRRRLWLLLFVRIFGLVHRRLLSVRRARLQ